jgi:hypothetical protein
MNKSALLSSIEDAFSWRQMPATLVASGAQVDSEELAEANSFLGRPFHALTCKFLDAKFEFIYWITPDAFRYYLPGIMCAGIRESRPELLVNFSIVRMLSRSIEEESFDDFFSGRWVGLRTNEYQACQEWLLWLSNDLDVEIGPEISRAFDLLEYLKNR